MLDTEVTGKSMPTANPANYAVSENREGLGAEHAFALVSLDDAETIRSPDFAEYPVNVILHRLFGKVQT